MPPVNTLSGDGPVLDPAEAISDVSVRAQLDGFFSACHAFLGASIAGVVWRRGKGDYLHRCSRPSVKDPKGVDPLFEKMLEHDEPLLIANLQEEEGIEGSALLVRGLPLRTLVSHPISIPDVEGEGCVYVATLVEIQFSGRWVERLGLLASWARFILAVFILAQSRERLQSALQISEQEANTDSMTQVWNRRGIRQLLTRELARADREQLYVAVVFVDMDGLKRINDSLGHPAGDSAILTLAETLIDSLRDQDAVGRYGGDEFVCVLTDHDHWPLKSVVQRLARQVNSTHFEFEGGSQPLSASFGYAITGSGGNLDVDALVGRADEAVYAAKRSSESRIFDYADLGAAE